MSDVLPNRYTRPRGERPRGFGRTVKKDLECSRCGTLVTFRYKGGLCADCDKGGPVEYEAGQETRGADRAPTTASRRQAGPHKEQEKG